MRIALACDHAGYRYKEEIKKFLAAKGHECRDFGAFSEDPVDYPAFIRPAAEAVARGECERAIVLGGSGNGEAIVSNRVPGIRCAVAWDAPTTMRPRSRSANAGSMRRPPWGSSRRF